MITVDQAPSSGELTDSSACCGQPLLPQRTREPSRSPPPAGGGQVGALLLSPFVEAGEHEPGNVTTTSSLLRTIEDLFGLSHLGYAQLSQVSSFPPSLFVAKG